MQDTENKYTYINMNAYKVNVLHVQCRCTCMYKVTACTNKAWCSTQRWHKIYRYS